MGDSIGAGWTTTGPINDAYGWADQVAGLTSYRVSNLSVPGYSASCWGLGQMQAALTLNPASVIVALGRNDMNQFYCSTTLDRFRQVMTQICSTLRASVPLVYLSAILPATWDGSELAMWNAAIQDVAQANGCGYGTPSIHVNSDLSDGGVHPNVSGHVKVANYWASVLA